MNRNDETKLVSAGDLARELGRSSYGVKKALMRAGIKPSVTLSGTAYFDHSTALAKLNETLRAPNARQKA